MLLLIARYALRRSKSRTTRARARVHVLIRLECNALNIEINYAATIYEPRSRWRARFTQTTTTTKCESRCDSRARAPETLLVRGILCYACTAFKLCQANTLLLCAHACTYIDVLHVLVCLATGCALWFCVCDCVCVHVCWSSTCRSTTYALRQPPCMCVCFIRLQAYFYTAERTPAPARER